MTEKQTYHAIFLLSIVCFLSSLIATYQSSIMESFAFLGIGWTMWSVARKKERTYKKDKH